MSPLILLLMIGLPMISQGLRHITQALRALFSRLNAHDGHTDRSANAAYNGVHDVQIIPTGDQLTDHYAGQRKRRSKPNRQFLGQCPARAVANHECGHTVQYATSCPLPGKRSRMVRFLKLPNFAWPVLSIGGAGFFGSQNRPTIAYLFPGVPALPTLFRLITLPVEFEARRRALRWMEAANVAPAKKHAGAKNTLW